MEIDAFSQGYKIDLQGLRIYDMAEMKSVIYILLGLMLIGGCANEEASTGIDETTQRELNKELLKESEDTFLDRTKNLLTKGADVNVRDDEDKTPLHWASYHANYEFVILFIQNGANVNSRDKYGKVPLHEAALHTYEDSLDLYTQIIEALIKNGADVNVMDKKGRTPLDVAKDSDLKKLLHSHSAKTGKELQKQDK